MVEHIDPKRMSSMAYLNYTAQDFASRLENRRPGVYRIHATQSNPFTRSTSFYILSLFSAMQNSYSCILHGNHYNYYHILCSDILISHKRMKFINIHMHRILNQNLGSNSSIIAIFTYIHRIHARISLKKP